MKKIKESELQSQIIEFLRLHKWFVVRINTTGVYNAKGDFWRKSPNKGIFDLFCLRKGKAVWLEIKSKNGVLSEEQETFRVNIGAHGGDAYVVRSFDAVELLMK